VRTSVEGARGCGYRKPGGYYLVAPQLSESCPLLPWELDRCPHCGQGFGPARGFTWITPAVLFPAREHGSVGHNFFCPLGIDVDGTNPPFEPFHRTGERAGLIWVGGLFYPTPESFLEEAAEMGVSRRVKAPPRGFKIGEHWIYLGHRKAITAITDSLDGETAIEVQSPGVISLFKPTAIEYVVKGDETDEEIEALEERGITPVKVIRDIDQ